MATTTVAMARAMPRVVPSRTRGRARATHRWETKRMWRTKASEEEEPGTNVPPKDEKETEETVDRSQGEEEEEEENAESKDVFERWSSFDDEMTTEKMQETADEVLDNVASAVTGQMPLADLKACLLDSFYGTERGLKASADTRAEVGELIAQLEARNPTPNPTEALEKLNGEWKLEYTSNSELYLILAAQNLPLLEVGNILQTINVDTMTVENKAELKTPVVTGSVGATASFEIRSPTRLQIKFNESTLYTPQPVDSLEIPSSLEIFGQRVDIAPLRPALTPIADAARSAFRMVSDRPDVRIPIRNEQAQSWILTTYLDDTLRIARGDGGSVFVLSKQNVW
mmetsp:Transcript_4824/g.30645  ORF Transcript_4824/g.30645 Transcript_4824/m.30645 type:complete len:342 (+) Transcript_4824:2343-3368(+)